MKNEKKKRKETKTEPEINSKSMKRGPSVVSIDPYRQERLKTKNKDAHEMKIQGG